MSVLALRLIYFCDLARFAVFRWRFKPRLQLGNGISPHLRLAELRIDAGGRVEIASGFATERRHGNQIWVQGGGVLRLGERAWLRTEFGPNQITAHPNARIEVGADAFINGAMLHAKEAIRIGTDVRIGFGARIFDADLHDLDRDTPERVAPVTIGDRVWIGANALVLRGVTIGSDVVVGAGSVVTRDLPSRCLAAGSPAKAIREIAPRTGCR